MDQNTGPGVKYILWGRQEKIESIICVPLLLELERFSYVNFRNLFSSGCVDVKTSKFLHKRKKS